MPAYFHHLNDEIVSTNWQSVPETPVSFKEPIIFVPSNYPSVERSYLNFISHNLAFCNGVPLYKWDYVATPLNVELVKGIIRGYGNEPIDLFYASTLSPFLLKYEIPMTDSLEDANSIQGILSPSYTCSLSSVNLEELDPVQRHSIEVTWVNQAVHLFHTLEINNILDNDINPRSITFDENGKLQVALKPKMQHWEEPCLSYRAPELEESNRPTLEGQRYTLCAIICDICKGVPTPEYFGQLFSELVFRGFINQAIRPSPLELLHALIEFKHHANAPNLPPLMDERNDIID